MLLNEKVTGKNHRCRRQTRRRRLKSTDIERINVPLFVRPAEIAVNTLYLSFSFVEAINRRDPKRKPFNHYKTLPSRPYYIRQASRIRFRAASNGSVISKERATSRASGPFKKRREQVRWYEGWLAKRKRTVASQPANQPASQSASQPSHPSHPSHSQSVSRALFIWSSTTPAST